MSMLSHELGNMVAKKCSIEIAFKKGKRDKEGNLVLKRSKIVDVMAYIIILLPIAFAVTAICTGSLADEDDLQTILIVMGVCTVVLELSGITLLISKTVVSREGITAYRITGKKHLDFIDVEDIRYTRFYGGCAVLAGNGIKIRVPMDTCGFQEFYEILKNRFGDERCKSIGKELTLRRMQV